jgi:hypothetical protein
MAPHGIPPSQRAGFGTEIIPEQSTSDTIAVEFAPQSGGGQRGQSEDEANFDESYETALSQGGADGEPPGEKPAVVAMRRFWDQEVAKGSVPTGASLSKAAGVNPSTGLGRRKRREWEKELPGHLRPTASAGT